MSRDGTGGDNKVVVEAGRVELQGLCRYTCV